MSGNDASASGRDLTEEQLAEKLDTNRCIGGSIFGVRVDMLIISSVIFLLAIFVFGAVSMALENTGAFTFVPQHTLQRCPIGFFSLM